MSMWRKLAALLGVRDDQVDDALVDEDRCKRQLSRRGLLLAGAAVAGGALVPKRAWSFSTVASFVDDWETIRITVPGGVYLFGPGEDLRFITAHGESSIGRILRVEPDGSYRVLIKHTSAEVSR